MSSISTGRQEEGGFRESTFWEYNRKIITALEIIPKKTYCLEAKVSLGEEEAP